MRSVIHTSLAPTVSRPDVARAMTLLAHPRAWRDGRERTRLEADLGNALGGSAVRALDSGRNALRLALQLLDIGHGDEVLLQAYTCVSVPGPVLWMRATPVYADIRPETFTMDPADAERKITPRTRAMIIQHTFGLPSDLDPLLGLARRHGLAVIEDCAHALGATYQGKPVGTFGDLAILSFGRDKVISSVFGGALVVHRADLKSALGRATDHLPLPSAPWVAQQLLHPIAVGAVLETYFAGGRFLLRALQEAGVLSKALAQREKGGGEPLRGPRLLPNALASLALVQLSRLAAFNARRAALAAHYRESLADLRGVRLPTAPQDRTHIFLRYTIRLPDPRRLHAAARRAGIILGDWYKTVVAPHDTDLRAVGYPPGSCPQAEEAARASINLPTSPTLSIPEADRVLRVVRAELARQ